MSHNIKTMYDSLRNEYTKAEDELRSVDNSLKKLIGTDTYNISETSSISRSKEADRRRTGRGYLEDSKRYSRTGEMGRKRRLSESNSRIFSRLDKRLDDDSSRSAKRPSLQSTIVSTNPSAQDAVKMKQENAVQDKEPDKKSVVRNRRMFGMIMGTLQKFQSEETQRKVVTTKREEIEKKLDKADAEEKEAVKKERQSLIRSRKDKQTHLRALEMRMERVEIHQQWEKSNQHLANFIQTKTKPHIFYMPKKLTPETEKRLKETKDKYLIILAEKRAKTQKEIEDLNKRDDELRKENLAIKGERHESDGKLKNGIKSEIRSASDRSDGKGRRASEEMTNNKVEAGDKEAISKEKRDKFVDDDVERMSDKSESKHSGESSNGPCEEAEPAAKEHSQKQTADESINGGPAASSRSDELAGDESNQTNEISQQTNDESITNQDEVSRSEANTEENTADNAENNAEYNTDDNSQQQHAMADKALEDKEFEPIYDE